MENMNLHLEQIDFRGNNSVGGILYMTIGTGFFPEERWYDMVSSDLDNWMPRLVSFAQAHTDSCVLPFMDGPCEARLAREAGGAVRVSCFWSAKAVIPPTEIDFRQFLDSVVKCVRQYDRVLYENGLECRFQRETGLLREIATSLRSSQ